MRVQSAFYRRGVFAQLCRDACRHVRAHLHGHARDLDQRGHLARYGRCSVNRPRYRTAVKDPLDLLYLFWAITTGITAGAGMYALVGLTAVVIVVMIASFASHRDKSRVYMMVVHYTGQTTGDDIVRAFGRTKFTVKSKTMRGDKVEWPSRCSRMALICLCRRHSRARRSGGPNAHPVQRRVPRLTMFRRFNKRRTARRCGHLPGDLPLKPSLAYIKYASLFFRGTSPRQLPAR